MKDTTHYQV